MTHDSRLKLQLNPINDQVLVKELQRNSKTESGIIIPETAKEKHRRGRVVGVGSGQVIGGQRVPLDVHKGDIVLYNEIVAEELTFNGETYYMLKYNGILGIINNAENNNQQTTKPNA